MNLQEYLSIPLVMSMVSGIFCAVLSLGLKESLLFGFFFGLYTSVIKMMVNSNNRIAKECDYTSNATDDKIVTNDQSNDQSNVEEKDKNKCKDTLIYVAGSIVEREELQSKMDILKNLGYTVTSRWPKFEKELNNLDDYAISSAFDIYGVECAHVVIAIMQNPTYAYRGTFTEIGCALSNINASRIIIINNGTCVPNEDLKSSPKFKFSHTCMESVFFWHPYIEHVSSFDDAIKLLNGEQVTSPFKKFYKCHISNNLDNSLKSAFDDFEPEELRSHIDRFSHTLKSTLNVTDQPDKIDQPNQTNQL